jgi:hypothetical protein
VVVDQSAATAGEDGRLIKHARYYWLLLAESHLTRRLFGSMLRRMGLCRCQPDKRGGQTKPIWTTERSCRGGVREIALKWGK